MKSSLIVGLSGALVVVASNALAATTNYSVFLEGATVGSTAEATGAFTYDDVAKQLCGYVTIDVAKPLTSGAITDVGLKDGMNDLRKLVKLVPTNTTQTPLMINTRLSPSEEAVLNGIMYVAIGTGAHKVTDGYDDNGEINGVLTVAPGNPVQTCPSLDVDSGAPDAGVSEDAGPAPDSGSSSEPPLAPEEDPSEPTTEDPTTKTKSKDDGGCSSTGSMSTGGAALAALVGTLVVRSRRRR